MAGELAQHSKALSSAMEINSEVVCRSEERSDDTSMSLARITLGKWTLTRIVSALQATLALENNGPPSARCFWCPSVECRVNPFAFSREPPLAEPYEWWCGPRELMSPAT